MGKRNLPNWKVNITDRKIVQGHKGKYGTSRSIHVVDKRNNREFNTYGVAVWCPNPVSYDKKGRTNWVVNVQIGNYKIANSQTYHKTKSAALKRRNLLSNSILHYLKSSKTISGWKAPKS